MELTDIASLSEWAKLEQEIHRESGLDANVFNTEGRRITEVKNWVNRLCPAIKDTDKGQAFICAVAHMNLAVQAKKTQQPVIEECDAGIVKIVVPILVDGEFVGAFGACGKVLDGGEVDTFMVNRTTGIEEETVEALSSDIGTLSQEKAEAAAVSIQARIQDILANRSS
ncbi:MAG: PocR ligand-binding domain-containing protein [Desulfobacteraceae bacterium]|nr:PocR ligand-binding domain-containing protein [Desulfobacteraceae bacterium]